MQNNEKNYKIAIDGGAGTGKSTLAKALAKRLNILHIDSGAMYRAATYFFINNNIEINEKNIAKHIEDINIELNYIDNMNIVVLNGENITTNIRSNEISKNVSNVAKNKLIREKLTELQRNCGEYSSIVMDGRDIASVVFPDSDIKLFLTTNITTRAKRRQKDLQKLDEFLSVKEIEKDLLKRDEIDMQREVAPLIKVRDAIEIDTSNFEIEQLLEKVIDILIDRKII